MAIRYGGETPDLEYGLEITVEAPDGTTVAAPVLQGSIWKLGSTAADGTGYKAVATADNDTAVSCVLLQAKHRITSEGPLAVKVLGSYAQIRRLPYLEGELPEIGHSVMISATAGLVGVKEYAAGCGYTLYVDTVAHEAEVLI